MDGGNSDIFDEDPRITSIAVDSLNGLVYVMQLVCIRESVDSLYRDETDEISRDPRTKRLKTR